MTQGHFAFNALEEQAVRERLPKPSDLSVELNRRQNNKDAVLQRLLKGSATGDELDAIAGRRFGGRIFELKQDGWNITSEPLSRKLFRYTLHGKKQQ